MKKIQLTILVIFMITGFAKSQTLNVPDNIETSNNAGKVGIGTTDPDDLLELSQGHLRISNTEAPRIIFNENNADYWRVVQDAGNIRFDYDTDDTFGGYFTGLKLESDGDIIMNGGGYVGIGTSNPTSALVITKSHDGSPNYEGLHFGLSGNYGSIELAGSNGGYIDFTVGDGTDRLGRIIYNNSSNSMFFQTNASNRMVISSDGDVGIGTTDPDDLLELSQGHLRISNTEAPRIIFNENNADYWRVVQDAGNIRFDYDTDDTFGGYFTGLKLESDGDIIMNGDGNVGIGTTSPDYKLDVIGTIRAQEIKVDLNGADFVFEDDYDLRTLDEVENFVKENKHLPEIDPSSDMEANGTDLGELNSKLLLKIEELTLYMIDMNKTVNSLVEENTDLKKEIEKLKAK